MKIIACYIDPDDIEIKNPHTLLASEKRQDQHWKIPPLLQKFDIPLENGCIQPSLLH
jgi:hypothetical protein